MSDANALMTLRANGNVQQQTHRNEKAGEFKHQLHEDMQQDDADLTSYPSDARMIVRWNQGVASAARHCEQLGMKHADITEAEWREPWTLDPANPDTDEWDEYASRKHGRTDDDNTEDNDGNNDDNDDDDADNDDDDDPNVAQAQLDYALDTIRNAVEADPNNDDGLDNDDTPRGMIRTPVVS